MAERSRTCGRRAALVAVTLLATTAAVVSTGSVAGADHTDSCLRISTTTDLGPSGAYGMTIDPVDHHLYVAVDGAGRVDVIHPTTHMVVDSIPVPNMTVGFVAIDHEGNTLYAGSFSGDAVYAIDLTTELPIATIPVPQAQSLAINTNTNRLYAAGQTSTVQVISTVSNTSVGTLAVGGDSLGVDVDLIHNRVFVTDFDNNTLDIFDGATRTLIDSVDLGSAEEPITTEYDYVTGNVWVTTRDPGEVIEVDPDTGETGVSFPLAAAQGLALNPELGQGYVTPSNGNVLTVFDVTSGEVLDTFPVGDDSLVAVATVGPVRVYASGLEDGTVTVVVPNTGPFSDVPGAHRFCFDIRWLVGEGVTEGFDDGTYRPLNPVTRGSMAAFLYRGAGEPAFVPPVTPTFPDVPTTHPFFVEIEWMVATDITGGFSDDTFRPALPVTRATMAAFLYRSVGEPAFVPPGTASFSDVPTSHAFFHEIEWLVSIDVTGGFDDGTYRPGSAVTRQSMAAFLHRFLQQSF
jgi:DNA-binding beta-propeller fold protein YncE